MFSVTINSECPSQLIVDFRELKEEYSQYDNYDTWLDNCFDIIENFRQKNPSFKESIDEYEDYYFCIDCGNEEQAETFEAYFSRIFDNLEYEINEEVDELENEDEDEDEEY